MFRNITNEEADHWNPMSDNPIIPNSQDQPFDVDNENGGGDDDVREVPFDAHNTREEEVQEVNPSNVHGNKRPCVAVDKKKKSSTALVIQEAITKMSESATSFTSKKQEGVTVKEVMDLVLDCGANYGSDEHDIATQLFVKKDFREMFMTFPTREIRFNWLRKRHNDKYGN